MKKRIITFGLTLSMLFALSAPVLATEGAQASMEEKTTNCENMLMEECDFRKISLASYDGATWTTSTVGDGKCEDTIQVIDNGSGIFESEDGRYYFVQADENRDIFISAEPVDFVLTDLTSLEVLESYGLTAKALEDIEKATQYAVKNDLIDAQVTIFVPSNSTRIANAQSVTTSTEYKGLTFNHRVVAFKNFHTNFKEVASGSEITDALLEAAGTTTITAIGVAKPVVGTVLSILSTGKSWLDFVHSVMGVKTIYDSADNSITADLYYDKWAKYTSTINEMTHVETDCCVTQMIFIRESKTATTVRKDFYTQEYKEDTATINKYFKTPNYDYPDPIAYGSRLGYYSEQAKVTLDGFKNKTFIFSFM